MANRHDVEIDRWIEELQSGDVATLLKTLERVEQELGDQDEARFRQLVEGLLSIFYIDTVDRPDLEDALDHAVEVVARHGARVVPILIAQMRSSDIKSHLYLARTLARLEGEALPALRELLATDQDAYARAFALYALGKMRSPEVVRALPEVLGGLMHPDREVRDSAARTLGKIAHAAPAEQLTPLRRTEMLESLLRATHDVEPPVRAKAMRSLGKMAQAGLLDEAQRDQVRRVARAACGESDENAWDGAYIVRREAREALGKLA